MGDFLGGLEAAQACAQNKIGAWKIVFLQSFRFLQASEENNVSGPQASPHMDFGWIVSSPSKREKNSLKKCFSAQPSFIP